MYRKNPKGWRKHFDFILLDLICLHVAFVLAYLIRHSSQNPYADYTYGKMLIVITLIQIVVAVLADTMKNVLKRGYYREFVMTLKQGVLVELLVVFYFFALREIGNYSRTVIFLMGILYVILGYTTRILLKRIYRRKMLAGGKRSLLIVTAEKYAVSMIEDIRNNNFELFQMAGLVITDQDMTGEMISDVPVVADTDSMIEYVRRQWIDEVLFFVPETESYPTKLVEQLMQMGIVVHISLEWMSALPGKKQLVERLGNHTVITTSINYATSAQLFIKRAMDIAGGLVGCLITGVLFIFLAPAIYIQSPGPIFFSQIRVGKGGKQFKMYKFRSMYMDAEERKAELMKQNRVEDGMMFKLDWDPRIIGSRQLPDGTTKKGVGNFIRDWSLDEFPQFFNILKGDMSLVGTRPPTLDEWEKYEIHHRKRLATKPGLTGMWQVSGRSNITDFEEVVKLDTKYISEWSIGLDCLILLKTLGAVVKKDGAM